MTFVSSPPHAISRWSTTSETEGMSFGFGGTTTLPKASSSSLGFGFAAPAAAQRQQAPSSSNPRRRRRSDTPSDRGEDEDMRLSPGVGSRQFSSHKKIKRLPGSRGASPGVSGGSEEADIGTLLANQSKSALLNILTSLINQQPQLKPIIADLMPPPTLESYTTLLDELERKILAAIPSGQHLREEYIWGRVRVSLEEYVAENRLYLNTFVSPDGSGQQQHPSTVFAFLYALTSSVERVENALPAQAPLQTSTNEIATAFKHVNFTSSKNPLLSALVPQLINAWHLHLTRTSTTVNQEGRILSAETVRHRFAQLDELCSDNFQPQITRRAMSGVRERMIREIGWLTGHRPAQSNYTTRQSSVTMEEL